MERIVFSRPKTLIDMPTHYCPGCHHGIVHRLVAEAIDELELQNSAICVGSVGCSVLVYEYLDVDGVASLHGRAPAVATGVKRVHPDKLVFTYQGDGDLAAIGTAEIVHAAARGENITVVFVNNAIYGMTGGQMAPTSLAGQVTQTSPRGRDVHVAGNPIRVCEMLNTLDGPGYLARVALHTTKHIVQAKKAIKHAFATQQAGQGFSLVEVLSTCPTNWRMTPVEASKWVATALIPHYPLGVFREPDSDDKSKNEVAL